MASDRSVPSEPQNAIRLACQTACAPFTLIWVKKSASRYSFPSASHCTSLCPAFLPLGASSVVQKIKCALALCVSPTGKIKPFKRYYALRKPKGLRLAPNQCLALDTVVRQKKGMKRFITTYIDPATHIAFAFAHTSSTSRNACALLGAIHDNFTYLKSALVLTDNGSEFKGDFAKHVTAKSITHWRTYPKTPKMNAHCERFNRSIQEYFVDYHEHLLFSDLELFNQKLANWLVQYHTLIPHLATKPQPQKIIYLPLRYNAS